MDYGDHVVYCDMKSDVLKSKSFLSNKTPWAVKTKLGLWGGANSAHLSPLVVYLWVVCSVPRTVL